MALWHLLLTRQSPTFLKCPIFHFCSVCPGTYTRACVRVHLLQVSPNYRRLGVGRRLMELAEMLALKQRGRNLLSSTAEALDGDTNLDDEEKKEEAEEDEVKVKISDELDDDFPLFGYDAPSVSEFWLHVEASETGAPARKLYEGLGYQSLPDDERR